MIGFTNLQIKADFNDFFDNMKPDSVWVNNYLSNTSYSNQSMNQVEFISVLNSLTIVQN